jgi:hypothetical protein
MVNEREEFEKWWAGHSTLVCGTKQQNRFVWICAIDALAMAKDEEHAQKQQKRKP